MIDNRLSEVDETFDAPTLLAIDVGVKVCDIATFINGELYRTTRADWSPGLPSALGFPMNVRIVVERPEHQGSRSNNAHPGDLINLAWSGARLAYGLAGAFGCEIIERTPTAWKGSIPKPQHHAIALTKLSPAELAILPKGAAEAVKAACIKGARDRWTRAGAYYYGASKIHNPLDAVALGLTELGRMKKGTP